MLKYNYLDYAFQKGFLMSIKISKLLSVCITIILFTSIITGCTDTASTPVESDDSFLTNTPTTQPATFEQPINYNWDPHVYSDIYRQAYGEDVEQTYYALMDAIVAGDQSISCPDVETMYNVDWIMPSLFPPYYKIVSGLTFEDGKIYINYSTNDEQREQLINQFKEQVKTIIESSGVMEGDSPEMIAIELYHYYSQIISYDYDAMDDESLIDVSSYRAIMELSGICQSFAPAYAYLCLQCGIDAVTTGGLSETEAHDWTLLTLDGKYYYSDPTFENGDGGIGLRYFGMTAAQRESQGGYIAKDYNIGGTNVLWGRDIDVTDERFAPLWEANIVDIQRKNGSLHIQCERIDGTQFEFVVE